MSSPQGSKKVGTYLSSAGIPTLMMIPDQVQDRKDKLPTSMCCSFRVLPPYQYKTSEALEKEISKTGKEKDWKKIDKLEKEFTIEVLQNQKLFSRYVNRSVRYHQEIQLQHTFSDTYLSTSSTKTAIIDLTNFPCELSAKPSKTTSFKIQPAIPGKATGDEVGRGDYINLYSDSLGDIGVSQGKTLEAAKEFFNKDVDEVNVGSHDGGFTIPIHQQLKEISATELAKDGAAFINDQILYPRTICGTDIVQLFHSESKSYILQNKDGECVLKKIYDGVDNHITSDVSSYWIVERKEDPDNGTPITSGDVISITNVSTGFNFKPQGQKADLRMKPLNHFLGSSSDKDSAVKDVLQKINDQLNEITHNNKHSEKGEFKNGDGILFTLSKNGGDELWVHIDRDTDGSMPSKDRVSDVKFYKDLIVIKKVGKTGRHDAFKLLGFKMFIQGLYKDLDHGGLSFIKNAADHKSVLLTLDDMTSYINATQNMPEFANNFTNLGIVIGKGEEPESIVRLIKLYVEDALEINEGDAILSADRNIIAVVEKLCSIVNIITSIKITKDLGDATLELFNILLEEDRKTNLLLPALLLLIDGNIKLISKIPTECVADLLERFKTRGSNDDEGDTLTTILCRLCRCKMRAIPVNQKLITNTLFPDSNETLPDPLAIKWDGTTLKYGEKPLKSVKKQEKVLQELELYESLLFGKNLMPGKARIVEDRKRFTMAECVSVISDISSKSVSWQIKSWYVKILIAAHIDTGTTETDVIPSMLTFQYQADRGKEDVVKATDNLTEEKAKNIEEEAQYGILLNWVKDWMREEKYQSCAVLETEEGLNDFKYDVIRLVEYLFRSGRIKEEEIDRSAWNPLSLTKIIPDVNEVVDDFNEVIDYVKDAIMMRPTEDKAVVDGTLLSKHIVNSLIMFLDGTKDVYVYQPIYGEQATVEPELFRSIYRFRKEENDKLIKMKKRCLRALRHAYESALYQFWNSLTTLVYDTIQHYDKNKERWVAKIIDWLGDMDFTETLHEVVIAIVRDEYDSRQQSDKKTHAKQRDRLITTINQMYNKVDLFSREKQLVKVLQDVMRYDDKELAGQAIEMIVLIKSSKTEVLSLLPKSEIILSDKVFRQRRKVVDTMTELLKIVRHELDNTTLKTVTKLFKQLRHAVFDKNAGINRSMQKLLSDLLLTDEAIRVILAPKDELSMQGDSDVDQVRVKMKTEAFKLLKYLISGHSKGQEIAMEYFTKLLQFEVKGAGVAEFEEAKVLALNEIFTANTSLSLNIDKLQLEEIFVKLVAMIKPNRPERVHSYHYFELLENIIDIEDSDQLLFKLQESILFLMKDYWPKFKSDWYNMSLILTSQKKPQDPESDGDSDASGDLTTDELLKLVFSKGRKTERSGISLFITRAMSLLGCCAVGDIKSSETICRRMVEYGPLIRMLRAGKDNIVYFKCLSKVLISVYVNSETNKDDIKITDVLENVTAGLKFVDKLNTTLADKKYTEDRLQRFNLMGDFKKQLKILTECGEEKDREEKDREEKDREEKDREYLHQLDYLFHDLIPLLTDLFKKKSTAIQAALDPQLTLNILKTFGERASPFISQDNFTQLKKVMERLDFHVKDNLQKSTTIATLVDRNGSSWYLSSKVGFKSADPEVKATYDEVIQDVIELRDEKPEKRKSKPSKDNEFINEMFRSVITALKKAMIKERDGLFIQSSLELESLGEVLFSSVTVNDRQKDSCVIKFGGNGGICIGKTTNFVSLNRDKELQFTIDYTQLKIIRWIEKDNCKASATMRILDCLTLMVDQSREVAKHDNQYKDEGLRKLKETVKALKECGLEEMVCGLMASTKRGVAEAAAACMLVLLSDKGVQIKVMAHCRQSDEALFEWCEYQISAAISSFKQMDHIAEESSYSSANIAIVTPEMRLAVKCIGALCANQYTDLQNYMRAQHNKIVSHNFLSLLVELLKCVDRKEMLIDVLDSVNEMVSGNMVGKEYAIEMGIVDRLDDLIATEQTAPVPALKSRKKLEWNSIGVGLRPLTCLEQTEHDRQFESHFPNQVKELLGELKVKCGCYILLSTLMEQDWHLTHTMDLSDKLFESLNIKELKVQVKSHLADMNNKSFKEWPEVRPQAAQAAFEGYDVLKSLDSMQDNEPLEGIEEIEEKIATDSAFIVESVEVMWNGSLKKLNFRKPSEDIREKIKTEMVWNIKRGSQTDKQKDFVMWSQEILKDMKQIKRLGSWPVMPYILKYEPVLDWMIFILALIIQIGMLFVWEDFELSGNTPPDKCINITSGTILTSGYVGYLCVPRLYYVGSYVLGFLHLFCCLSVTCVYFAANNHRLTWECPWKIVKDRRLNRSYFSPYHVWLPAIIVLSILGIFTKGYVFAFHLFHIVTLFDILTRVVKGTVKNWRQLLVSLLLAVIVIYVWAIVWFWTGLRKMFTNSSMEYCDTLAQCMVTSMLKSLRPSPGGHNIKWTDHTSYFYTMVRTAMDIGFWIAYTLLCSRVFTALVIEGFNTLKTERVKAVKDMENKCTICGLTKDELSNHGIQWEDHIDKEHNMWSYTKLFYHLQQERSDGRKLNAVESHVLDKFEAGDIDFLPTQMSISVNRAINKSKK